MLALTSTASLSLLLCQRPLVSPTRPLRTAAVLAALAESDSVVSGEVLWFDDAKGYGFLQIDKRPDDQVATC